MSESNLQQIMKEIEAKTETRVDILRRTNANDPAGAALVNIMKDGANEFKEKTGRNMTYSEMRQMYG